MYKASFSGCNKYRNLERAFSAAKAAATSGRTIVEALDLSEEKEEEEARSFSSEEDEEESSSSSEELDEEKPSSLSLSRSLIETSSEPVPVLKLFL